MKNIILITFLFLIYNCGYTSVYKNLGEQDFQLILTEVQGDRDMGNLIKNEIDLYSNNNSINIFNITADIKYEKSVLTKDATGTVTDYELSVNSAFVIYFSEKSKKVTFSETISIKNQTDSFEQDSYEKNIKRNFASSIREKLISEIITIR